MAYLKSSLLLKLHWVDAEDVEVSANSKQADGPEIAKYFSPSLVLK